MRVYAIRHKPKGAFMPLKVFASGRGASYWEPTGFQGLGGWDKNPRIFYTLRSAQNALTAWLSNDRRGETCSYGCRVCAGPAQPRKREDMEIVEFELTEISHA